MIREQIRLLRSRQKSHQKTLLDLAKQLGYEGKCEIGSPAEDDVHDQIATAAADQAMAHAFAEQILEHVAGSPVKEG